MPLLTMRGASSALALGHTRLTTGRVKAEQVFATSLWNGTGASQTITNGIDFTKGGMVWIKNRSGTDWHNLYDTARGASAGPISSNSTNAGSGDTASFSSFNSDGFTLGTDTNYAGVNFYGVSPVAWSFRKAPKYFDIVTYTGTGSPRTLNHKLGVAPGLMIIKKTTGVSDWAVYHRSVGNGTSLFLDTTSTGTTSSVYWNNTDPTATTFTLGGFSTVNQSGQSYVAYLFAHDADPNGIIQCGSYTTDASGNATVNLGWRPQFLLVKCIDSTDNWNIVDLVRSDSFRSGTYNFLYANSNNAEANPVSASNMNYVSTSSGFQISGQYIAGTPYSGRFVYMAIRMPSSGVLAPTKVQDAFAVATYAGNSGTQTIVNAINLADNGGLVWIKNLSIATDHLLFDNLRSVTSFGYKRPLRTNKTDAEGTTEQYGVTNYRTAGFDVEGVDPAITSNGYTFGSWTFRRAAKFFDIVPYTGNGATGTIQAHNLGITPGMVIIKARDSVSDWTVIRQDMSNNDSWSYLNSTDGTWGGGSNHLTSSSFYVMNNGIYQYNTNGTNYIAYLFAHDPDITKGLIQCGGVTTDASGNATAIIGWEPRFVLMKPYSGATPTGDWIMVDSLRGWGNSGNDQAVYPNSTQAQVPYTDLGMPTTTGFRIAGLNASTTYTFVAIRKGPMF